MSDAMLLNLVLVLPLLGALLLALVRHNPNAVRVTTTAVLTVQFVLASVLYAHLDGTVPGLQAATSVPWIVEWGVSYAIGLDGVNVLLVLLTAFLGPLVILASMDIAVVISIEAGLSFLGLGVRPPLASWGTLIQDGYQYLSQSWLPVVVSSVALALTTLGFTLFGEALRDAVDPRIGREH